MGTKLVKHFVGHKPAERVAPKSSHTHSKEGYWKFHGEGGGLELKAIFFNPITTEVYIEDITW